MNCRITGLIVSWNEQEADTQDRTVNRKHGVYHTFIADTGSIELVMPIQVLERLFPGVYMKRKATMIPGVTTHWPVT